MGAGREGILMTFEFSTVSLPVNVLCIVMGLSYVAITVIYQPRKVCARRGSYCIIFFYKGDGIHM